MPMVITLNVNLFATLYTTFLWFCAALMMAVMTMILVVLVRELFGTGKHQSQAFNGRTGRTDKRGGAHGSVEEEEKNKEERMRKG